MKKINVNTMTEISGGSNLSAGIAGAACAGVAVIAGFASFGIGAAILGPTCIGMSAYTLWD